MKRTRSHLARSKGLDRRTRLKPVSDKRRADRQRRNAVRGRVFERAAFRCQFPHDLVPELPCFGDLTFGHLKKASAGGAYVEDNGMAMCAVSNTWIEDNPVRALEFGLVIR